MEINNQAERPIEETYDKLTPEELENMDPTNETVIVRYFHEVMKYLKIWEKIIETGQKDGTIRSDLPPRHLTQIIQIFITGAIDQIVLQRNALKYIELPIETVEKVLIETLRKTLEP